MNNLFRRWLAAVLLPCGFSLAAPAARAADGLITTSVYSTVHNGYQRQRMPDGTFKRETYAIGRGRYAPGLEKDDSIDHVAFPVIAGLVAEQLARQNYYLAQDARSADFLLVISWGTSIPFSDGTGQHATDSAMGSMDQVRIANQTPPGPRSADGIQSAAASIADAARDQLEGDLIQMQMFSGMRQKSDERNARLLGYVQEINDRADSPARFAGAGTAYDDLISDIEHPRYYLIISAYDFKTATQEKKLKLLWVTRVSIDRQGNRFDERIVAMLANAGKKFGQNSGGLIRQDERSPRVNLGELKIMGVVPDEPKADGAAGVADPGAGRK